MTQPDHNTATPEETLAWMRAEVAVAQARVDENLRILSESRDAVAVLRLALNASRGLGCPPRPKCLAMLPQQLDGVREMEILYRQDLTSLGTLQAVLADVAENIA